MSAEQYGAGLLAEVQEEPLNEILASLRHGFYNHNSSLTGLSKLDELIQASRCQDTQGPDEVASSVQQLDHHDESPFRNNASHDPTRSNAAASECRLPIIEITSSTTSCGKTSLLYLLAATAILPRFYKGQESTVVWLDTDARFSAGRLNQICLDVVAQSIESAPSLPNQSVTSIVKEALRHVHIFPIHSSQKLMTTLKALPSYLLQEGNPQLPKHHSSHRSLSLIILDSAQPFYWPDRFDTELARLEAVGSSNPSALPASFPPDPSTIPTKLKALQAQFESTIIYTTNHTLTTSATAINRPTPSTSCQPLSTANPLTPNRPNLAPSYDCTSPNKLALSVFTTSATLSLSLSRISVPRFASHMTLDECLRDRENRITVVQKGRVGVRVNEVWLERVARPMSRNRGGKGKGLTEEAVEKLRRGFVVCLGTDGGAKVE